MKRINCYGRELNENLPSDYSKLKNRIMYIENKSHGIDSADRIGLVYFSRTGKTLYYKDKVLKSLNGRGYKSNYFDIVTGDEYWISGVKKNRNDRLYGGYKGVEIDEDKKESYFSFINNKSAQQGDAPEPASGDLLA